MHSSRVVCRFLLSTNASQLMKYGTLPRHNLPTHRILSSLTKEASSINRHQVGSAGALYSTNHVLILRKYSSTSQSDAVKAVGDLVQTHRVVLFMKGNPDEPRCGFSNAVCRILEMHGILDKARIAKQPGLFASYDVLENEELRSAAKTYSDWPTFPQVYFDGEFVGGCDILLDMHKSGKLIEELERLGIGSALSDTPREAT
ncbi:glutaredoxin-related protein 5 mitochondrial [Clonorchis sinensis]|uniref:Glutaredoxin-related protein 5, mitochondrial n=1 Tax=Clonorchis sinensis TaxID=79923 RepID=G7YAG2_CLOSI|nr:glutaredoxin-related protein 5 mitochondrial [Clonorchis sinensis]